MKAKIFFFYHLTHGSLTLDFRGTLSFERVTDRQTGGGVLFRDVSQREKWREIVNTSSLIMRERVWEQTLRNKVDVTCRRL